ncbi:MAG: hypothetical protein P8M61_00320 [Crocinitomicaceae bacterium]|nr:hypothetical protein [Crocinitomicaceae bacterium]
MKVGIILCLILLITSLGCKKNNPHPVPSYTLDITIDINLPSYINLTGVSGYAYVNGGSRGVIVYRRGIDDFVAFDRHSPADVNGDCPQPLTPDVNNFLTLLDTCNTASFSLYDGSPISNSDFGLRQYQTIWDGTSKLRIYN